MSRVCAWTLCHWRNWTCGVMLTEHIWKDTPWCYFRKAEWILICLPTHSFSMDWLSILTRRIASLIGQFTEIVGMCLCACALSTERNTLKAMGPTRWHRPRIPATWEAEAFCKFEANQSIEQVHGQLEEFSQTLPQNKKWNRHSLVADHLPTLRYIPQSKPLCLKNMMLC